MGFLKTLTGCIFGLLTNHCHVMDCCCRCFWTFSPILDQSWRVILRWLLQACIECIGVGLGISVFWLFAAEHLLILNMFVCHFIILRLGSASCHSGSNYIVSKGNRALPNVKALQSSSFSHSVTNQHSLQSQGTRNRVTSVQDRVLGAIFGIIGVIG